MRGTDTTTTTVLVATSSVTAVHGTDDAGIVELVGQLALASERFRRLWARHDVRELEGGPITVNHPIVGPLRLNRDKLPAGEVILVLYYPPFCSTSALRSARIR